MKTNILRVGLTGGIACGKSNALRHFDRLGAHTIDADALARTVVEPGKPAFQELVAAFGEEMIRPDGTLDRSGLANIVFSDPKARSKLNSIVHPHIIIEEGRLIEEFDTASNQARSPIVIVDAALMIEVGTYRNYDVIVVAYCPPGIQLQRLMSRDDMSEEEALKRIRSQIPLVDKAKFADYVVDTTGKLSDTFEQTRYIYHELLERYALGAQRRDGS